MRRVYEHFAFRHLAPLAFRHLRPVPAAAATGLLAQAYAQMERDFQVAPPLTLHSANPRLLAAVWACVREALVCPPADRVQRELVAVGVSRLNACPYCAEVHGMMLEGAGQARLAKQAQTWPGAAEPNAGASVVLDWAAATRSPGHALLAQPPFAVSVVPQMQATAVLFHYINRMVNVFLGDSPIALALPPFAKRSLGAALTHRLVRVQAKPGEFLLPAPNGALPPEFAWATGHAPLARALAQWAQVVQTELEPAVPPSVRSVVQQALHQWRGADPGLGQAWVQAAVAGLTAPNQALARLALLSALAAYQVSDADVLACRQLGLDDAQLLGLVAWSSFASALRLASWVAGPL